jgi:hypothetical protein
VSTSIFGKQQQSSSVITAPVYEGYDVLDHGDLLAIQESYDDQLSIVQHIHELDSELLVLESDLSTLKDSGATDQELEQHRENVETVMEASVAGAWESIKAFFRKLWGKLKAFFASVTRYFDGLFRSAQGFVKKYETNLKRLDLGGYKFTMHDYTHLENDGKVPGFDDAPAVKALYDDVFSQTAASAGNDAAMQKLRGLIETSKDKKEEILNGVRGRILGGGSMTPEEFRGEAFGYFRAGAKNHEARKEMSVDINKVMNSIKNQEAKKKVDDFLKETDKEFSDVIKRIGTLENAFKGAKVTDSGLSSEVEGPSGAKGEVHHSASARGTIIEGLRTLSTQITATKDIHLAFFRSWREAWAERDRTYRSVCVQAFSYKKASA